MSFVVPSLISNNTFITWRHCYEPGPIKQLKTQLMIFVMCARDQACRKLGTHMSHDDKTPIRALCFASAEPKRW